MKYMTRYLGAAFGSKELIGSSCLGNSFDINRPSSSLSHVKVAAVPEDVESL